MQPDVNLQPFLSHVNDDWLFLIVCPRETGELTDRPRAVGPDQNSMMSFQMQKGPEARERHARMLFVGATPANIADQLVQEPPTTVGGLMKHGQVHLFIPRQLQARSTRMNDDDYSSLLRGPSSLLRLPSARSQDGYPDAHAFALLPPPLLVFWFAPQG